MQGTAHNGAQAYYEANGYYVWPALVNPAQADRLVDLYKEQVAASTRRFFRQSTNRYERNQFSSGGHVIQSFLDIHNYRSLPEFRRAALDIYLAPALRDALNQVTGSLKHNLMQTMLFDANTETQAHQDWWYLDSVPNGHLLGAWIALEDIHEDAGRFYVVPGSHEQHFHREGMTHQSWIDQIVAWTEQHPERVKAPALRKGDVLFWNSRLVHGSLPTKDPRRSRKSLTAHFLPSEYMFGNLFTQKPWVRYETIDGLACFANQPEYSLKARAVSHAKSVLYEHPALLRWARRFQRGSIADAS